MTDAVPGRMLATSKQPPFVGEAVMQHLPILVSGALIGLSMAAPIGPMGVLCINRTLADGMTIGVITGMGASTVHICYGGIVFLGLEETAPWVARNAQIMSGLGATLMFLFSLRLLRTRQTARPSTRVGTMPLLIAYGSAVIFNLTNPLTVLLLIGAVTAVFGSRVPNTAETELLLCGLFLGSALWWFCLSGATSLFRGRLTAAALRSINRIAAAVLFGFGLLAVAHALQV